MPERGKFEMPGPQLEEKLQAKAEVPAISPSDAMRDEAHQLQRDSVLRTGIKNAVGLVSDNRTVQKEIADYGSAGLKTAALFFRGRIGTAATLVLYASDEAKYGDTTNNMLVDGSLGALKGGVMKGTFSLVGASGMDPAYKALALGVSGRMTHNFLDRGAYHDGQGNFDLGGGLSSALSRSLDSRALGLDLVTFGVAHGMFKGTDAFTAGRLSRSPLMSTAFMGGSFGLISGASEEFDRQSRTGTFNWSQLAMRSVARAGVDALASLPAGYQAARMEANRQVGDGRTTPEPDAPKRMEQRAVGARPITPKLELTGEQIAAVGEAAHRNGLWLMQTPKVELAPDGTPRVMPHRGNFDSAAKATIQLANEVNHAVTLQWNGVDVRIEPRSNLSTVTGTWESARNAPERLAEQRRINDENARQRARDLSEAERRIEALAKKPHRSGTAFLESLHQEAANVGTSFATFGMSQLRHPAEILEFTRAYHKMHPQEGLANIESNAGRFAQPGTASAWKTAAETVRAEGPLTPTPAEQTVFGRIAAFETASSTARQHELVLRTFNDTRVVVEPSGPYSITEAGGLAGQFAKSIGRPEVLLSFNAQLIPVRSGASGAEVTATWRKQNRR